MEEINICVKIVLAIVLYCIGFYAVLSDEQ